MKNLGSQRQFLCIQHLDERNVPSAVANDGGADVGQSGLIASSYTSGIFTQIYRPPEQNKILDRLRTARGDVNGDGVQDTIVVTGQGGPVQLFVIDGADHSKFLVQPFAVYDPGESDYFGANPSPEVLMDPRNWPASAEYPVFTGGATVAVGDLSGSGRADIVVSADQGGGPRVTVFHFTGNGSGNGPGELTRTSDFFGIDDPHFRGGSRTAVGDVNGDGRADLVVAAGAGGGPRVAIFDGSNLGATGGPKLVGDFYAFEPTVGVGVNVAVGDVTGDGHADLIFGAGKGGAPRVRVFSGVTVLNERVPHSPVIPINDFFVRGITNVRTGIDVMIRDADQDQYVDIMAVSLEISLGRVYYGKGIGISSGEPILYDDLAFTQ
ncbi:MAG: VCBS repeat-containing protein [Gemmataceae bacterium]